MPHRPSKSSLLSLSIATCMSLTATMKDLHAATPQYSLTIYSSAQPGQLTPESLQNYGQALPGYGLVRDRRVLTLPNGSGEVRFTDVATRIDPTTVSFASLTDPAGTRVIEQNYQFDIHDPLTVRRPDAGVREDATAGTARELAFNAQSLWCLSRVAICEKCGVSDHKQERKRCALTHPP